MHKRSFPTFQHEETFWQRGIEYVAGVDEVGRGAFAGPVVTAAVILPKLFPRMDEINDSKLLSPVKREELAVVIAEHARAYTITEISVEVINMVGIGKATQQGFLQSIQTLSQQPQHILVDAFYIDGLDQQIQTPLIHGDQISISIAAASIIAKVYRDALMTRLHTTYSMYNFSKHKGYGTKEHREAIKQYGLSDIHRTSFSLKKFLV